MGEPHVLVVSYGDDDESPTYTVECPGVSDDCRGWLECQGHGCPPFVSGSREEDAAIDEGDYFRHGLEHRRLAGLDWCTPTGLCFLASHDHLDEEAHELAVDHQLGPGRYPVRVEWSKAYDSTELHLALIPDEEVDRAEA